MFFMEVKDKETDRVIPEGSEDEDDNVGIAPGLPNPSATITIPGFEGKKFKEKSSLIQKYSSRPEYLDSMCLAQFIICYDMMPLGQGRKKEKELMNGISNPREPLDPDEDYQYILTLHGGRGNVLPQYIKLDNNLGYMRLRKVPKVLRKHNFGRHNAHKHMYSEILLYHPFRQEEELEDCEMNVESCTELFMEMNITENFQSKSTRSYYISIKM